MMEYCLFIVIILIVPRASPTNIAVTPTSSWTIAVTWQPIPLRDRNGVIVKQNITYYSSLWMHGDTIQVNGSSTSVILERLIPFTAYNITVRAATIIGFGPDSTDAVATTLQAGR